MQIPDFVMHVTVIAALFAFAAVIISVTISFFTQRKILRNELLKIEASIEQNFILKILEERCKRYPKIYEIISRFARNLELTEKSYRPNQNLSKEYLQKLKDELEAEDVQHGIFFTTATAYCYANLRNSLYSKIDSKKELVQTLNQKEITELRTEVSLLETAMKKDLGIMIEEFQFLRNKYQGQDYHEFISKSR